MRCFVEVVLGVWKGGSIQCAGGGCTFWMVGGVA